MKIICYSNQLIGALSNIRSLLRLAGRIDRAVRQPLAVRHP